MKNEWEEFCRNGQGSNPMLTAEFRMELGTDKNGKNWICRAEWLYMTAIHMNKWSVGFDTDEAEEDSPFLRHTVLDADNYWKARKEVYQEVRCDYEDIYKVVEQFKKAHGIA